MGLELLQTKQPALVITNILMPDKERIETIRHIRRLGLSAKIAAISGGSHFRSVLVKDFACYAPHDRSIGPPRHDPSYAQAHDGKSIILNPNFSIRLSVLCPVIRGLPGINRGSGIDFDACGMTILH